MSWISDRPTVSTGAGISTVVGIFADKTPIPARFGQATKSKVRLRNAGLLTTELAHVTRAAILTHTVKSEDSREGLPSLELAVER